MEDFDVLEQFEIIKDRLFLEIVLRKIGQYKYSRINTSEPYSIIRVVPASKEVPVMISRPSSDGNKYWDDPTKKIHSQEAVLLFISYFDWQSLGYIDLQYIKAKIISFKKRPDLRGRECLLKTNYGKIYYASDAS
jgi:hypothetical protein